MPPRSDWPNGAIMPVRPRWLGRIAVALWERQLAAGSAPGKRRTSSGRGSAHSARRWLVRAPDPPEKALRWASAQDRLPAARRRPTALGRKGTVLRTRRLWVERRRIGPSQWQIDLDDRSGDRPPRRGSPRPRHGPAGRSDPPLRGATQPDVRCRRAASSAGPASIRQPPALASRRPTRGPELALAKAHVTPRPRQSRSHARRGLQLGRGRGNPGPGRPPGRVGVNARGRRRCSVLTL